MKMLGQYRKEIKSAKSKYKRKRFLLFKPAVNDD